MSDEELNAELGRWQEAIRNKLIDQGAPDFVIDGAGCDSGDPLDFTLCEIEQGVGYFKDHHAAELSKMRRQRNTWIATALALAAWSMFALWLGGKL